MQANGNGAVHQPPFVQITVDERLVSPLNPNGIRVSGNFKPDAIFPLIDFMAEGIRQIAMIGAAGKNGLSSSIVLPDGSPAPLPTSPQEPVKQ